MKFIVFSVSIILLNLLKESISHPTYYAVNRNETCYNPTPAPIYSWHVHVLYYRTNDTQIQEALNLRNKFAAHFNLGFDKPCDLFHNDYMCMFEEEREPAGPFITSQWSVYFLNDDYVKVVPWITQNRAGLDVLVHPNSGCEIEDHSWWATWAGHPWPLKLFIFSHDSPFPWNYDREQLLASKSDMIHQTKEEMLQSGEVSDLIKTYLSEYEKDSEHAFLASK